MTTHAQPIARAAAASPAAGPAATPRVAALWAVVALIAGAWLAAVLLEVTGHAAALHHHALIEGEDGTAAPPLWLAIPLFLAAWQLMIAGMMLPASLRAVGVLARSRLVSRPAAALTGFLGAYSLAWTAFGLLAFIGDVGLHRLVDATPWLAARPWLIEATALALAGGYQLLPLRRRALEACRHPRATSAALVLANDPRVDLGVGFRIGLAHALDCLVCSWALMLLMFAAGVANLAWMAVLAGVMAYEALGRHGARFGIVVGLALLGAAVVAAPGVIVGF
ncbi:MAG TPA: DUF2182 domain-containing protein [Candidatus Limnocylindrales bacterium]|nr:DUF2182 domain-containing protein [Candidatus Limnocylindrales bacterium]